MSKNHLNYSIMQLKPMQAEQVCRDITATLPEWFGIPEANERYALGMRERISFGAVIDEHCVGMITIEFPFHNNANIYWMGIEKKHIRKGVGIALLKYAEGFCQSQNCRSITVETLSPKEKDDNYLSTYQFYIKAGFQPLFELHTYGPEYLMVYLKKDIPKEAFQWIDLTHELQEEISSPSAYDRNSQMERKTTTILRASAENLKVLDDAITDYNIVSAKELPRAIIQRLDFIAVNSKGHLIGGIQSMMVNWGILEIDLLFVSKQYRKLGVGSQLLGYVEDIARKSGCYLSHLSTFDFQAKDFYLKHGYEIFGILENCPRGHQRYYVSKKID